MRKCIALIAFLGIHGLMAQKIDYNISFPNSVHHEAAITLTASGMPAGKATFRMSRSSPGRYATHEFGKNVYDVKAFDQQGKSIAINRVDGDVYEVPQQNGFVKVAYTLYANYADGTYSGVDPSSIHLNMPATFMWIKGFDKAPISIQFEIPNGFSIATQLQPGSEPNKFNAPGLQYFMDAPTKIGKLVWKDWTIGNAKFRLALEAETTDSMATAFATKIQRITEEATTVYGELPAYDYGTYTFIASINPYVEGDGMEHRNSTMISIPMVFNGSDELLEVFSHEFFHCWNVERIRPKTLEPFNFEKSNMSNELWCAEGFTQYYGDLLIRRSGFATVEDYLPALASVINAKEVAAGAKRFSPAEMSRHAVFVDAGVSVDKTNYGNMYSSYYPYGAAVALALELELRTKFNHTLDDYMTVLWKRFGKTAIPYTIPLLEEALASLTNKSFAAEFFSKYVTGHESFEYKTALEKAGLILKKPNAGKAFIGSVQYREGTAIINSNTIMGSALYNAGLDYEDEIKTLDGKTIKNAAHIRDVLAQHKPGDTVAIEFTHRGQPKTATMVLGESQSVALVTFEQEGRTPTQQQLQLRNNWLSSKLK